MTGQYARYLNVADDVNSLSSNRIQSLFQDNAGDIWLGSYDKGLNRFLGNRVISASSKNTRDKNSLPIIAFGTLLITMLIAFG